MTRSLLSLALCVCLAACSDDTLPTAIEAESAASSVQRAKSPRIDRAPVPPVFFNALNPVPFAEVREWPEWVPIMFLRDMSCVPHDINFLASARDPRSVTCPPITDGFLIWPDHSPTMPQVLQERSYDPVPMWFVSLDDWFVMADDGFVGWDELRSAPSFREGLSDYFHHRRNFVSWTITRDIRGNLTSHEDTRFRVQFVARIVYNDDGSMTEIVPRYIVEFD